MTKRINKCLVKTKNNIKTYVSHSKLFLTYIIFSILMTLLVRQITLGNIFDYEPLICDLAIIVIMGAFAYFFKPKNQFKYFLSIMIIISIICVVNSIYYTFYNSFASFSLLTELKQVSDVSDSVVEKLKLFDFIYLLFPLAFYFLHKFLKNKNYYLFVKKIEKAKKMFKSTIMTGFLILCLTLINITATDASRLVKQWNRNYLVQRFGIILYQGNDLFQSVILKVDSFLGYDKAVQNFKDYYSENSYESTSNEYTNAFEGMNIIFVHLESQQNFLVDMKINDTEITPTLNKLTKEGLYFEHFYPQISIGTSSDSEFTLNTSLMPANNGTVFVSYHNREYVSIPKLLSDKGYYTFSTHANDSSMWSRYAMHPKLGYQEMIFKDEFVVNEEDCVGLGLSDQQFYLQLQTKLEKIEKENKNYMGTIIQLSNHSPFGDTQNNPEIYNTYDKLDLTNTYIKEDGTITTDDYLDGTKLGNYLISAHYADMALGEFLEYIENSQYYENTLFVFYGDHEAKLGKSELSYYYNYDIKTGNVYDENDTNYVDFGDIEYQLNTNTPLIIWSKNEVVKEKLRGVNSNVMGMYDVLPTIGNMMGFESKYALGHDIFDIKDNNIVIFPNGNFLTNEIYYSNNSDSYRIINTENNVEFSADYVDKLKKYTEERLLVSNDIIVYDLIAKEGNNFLINELNVTKE